LLGDSLSNTLNLLSNFASEIELAEIEFFHCEKVSLTKEVKTHLLGFRPLQPAHALTHLLPDPGGYRVACPVQK
jgi:hypothetical protein